MTKDLYLEIKLIKISPNLPNIEIKIHTDYSFRLKTADAIGWIFDGDLVNSSRGKYRFRKHITDYLKSHQEIPPKYIEYYLVGHIRGMITSKRLWHSSWEEAEVKMEEYLKSKETGFKYIDKFTRRGKFICDFKIVKIQNA